MRPDNPLTHRTGATAAALALALAATLIGSVSACSGASSPTGHASQSATTNPAIQLLDRLDSGTQIPHLQGATVVNVQQVRSLLALPADTPPLSFTDATHRHYAQLLAAVIPVLGSARPVPALDAIDFGQVTAAANNGNAGREQVVVLATTQSFDQLADKLAADGYTRSGDLLRKPVGNWTTDITAIAGTPGIIALGTDPAAVQAAAEGRAHGISGPVRDALTSLDAPAAEALAPTGTCVTAVALADDVSGDKGRLLVVTGTPQANRLTATKPNPDDPAPPMLRFLGTPTVSGLRLTAPFSFSSADTKAAIPISPLGSYLEETPLDQIYQCP